MTVLATPIRGLRMMTLAAGLMMLRYALELALAVWTIGGEGFDDIASLLTWSARLRLVDLTALTLLLVGVASNLGELRRRRLSLVTGAIAIAAFAITFAVHAWMYDLLTNLSAGFRGDDFDAGRLGDLEKVPGRILLATIAYVAGLSATVVMIRGYAVTDGNLGLREQARTIGGMLILLLIADTFYRYTYGLGGGEPAFGVFGIAIAIGLSVFWFWCHRKLGSLFDTAKYYLRATADVPIAEVHVPVAVVAPPRPAPPPPAPPPPPSKIEPLVAAPAPIAPPKIEPLAAAPPAAPRADDAPPSSEGGPRFLR